MNALFPQLRSFDPDGVREAAQAWRRLSAHGDAAGSRHRTQVNGPLRQSWSGRDADAAFYAMEQSEEFLDVLRVECEAAALTLDTVAERMDQARTDLLNALRRADEWDLPVTGDGLVGLPSAEPGDRHDPDARERWQRLGVLRGQVQQRIDAALAAAREASDRGARALEGLEGGILTRPGVFGRAAEAARDAGEVFAALGLGEYLPGNTDPQRSADWWRSLTPEQQRAHLALHPAEVGQLDGLPAAVRDRANRLVLEQQLDALRAGSPRGSGLTYGQYDERQNALRVLKERLDRRDGGPSAQRLFLLGLEPAGDGRAIVALGDPDTAQHTAVLVPGTGTTLARMPGQLERIGRLQQAACAVAPGRSVSVISWLGYDAPEIPPESLGVAGRGRAEDGAEAMRRFTRGTRVAQGGNRSHLTVIGHSYGTTAVGAAAAGGEGLDADDLVAIASPGMTTAHASDLHAAPGHVWVGAAGNDPIRLAAGRTLGADPMAAPFGGTVIATDTSGHSGYWDPDSQSLLNQGRIIAGKQPATVAG